MKDRVYTHQEMSDLKDLVVKPGWKVFKSLIEDQFGSDYYKLRKGWTQINDYAHLCGVLDGLDKAKNIAENTIEEYDQQPEEG